MCPDTNNKGNPPSLISAFVARCLDCAMSLASVTKILSLVLASVAEQASLSLTWSETPEDTFSHNEAQVISTTILSYHYCSSRFKLACSADETSSGLVISTIGSRDIILSRQQRH